MKEKELKENIDYWESVKRDTEVAINHQKRRHEQAEEEIRLNRVKLEELSPEPCAGLLCITEKDILQDLGEFYIRVPLKNPVYIEEAAEWLEARGFKHNGGLPPDQLFELDHVRGSSFIFLQCTTETHSFNVLVCDPCGRGLGELPEAKYYARNKVEARNKERVKQLKHGHEIAERLRSLADSIEGSGAVDVHLSFANTGITPLHHEGSSPTITWLDSGSRRLELNYTLPKN